MSLDLTEYLAKINKKANNPLQATIREAECIGCLKCFRACPVDAIVGATKQLHTVIANECTGCELCVEPCPVDCIDMVPVAKADNDPMRIRMRFEARIKRLSTIKNREKNTLSTGTTERKAYILAALERVKAKRQTSS